MTARSGTRPQLPKPAAVLFDWDNTLVDNWPVVQRALNTARAAYGLPALDMAETLANARLSARDSFPRMFGNDADDAKALFYQAFEAGHLDGLNALPGASDLLELLAMRGIPAAVVSNKRGNFLRAEVRHLGWETSFGAVVGAGDAVHDKPDPAPALQALARLQTGAAAGVWFVGDTDVDMRCGLAAGCIPILVETTDLPPAFYTDCPPEARVPDLPALLRLVTGA
jgi:phosphoglycolate phosphatase